VTSDDGFLSCSPWSCPLAALIRGERGGLGGAKPRTGARSRPTRTGSSADRLCCWLLVLGAQHSTPWARTNCLSRSKPAHGDETDRRFLKQPTSVHSNSDHTWKFRSGALRQKLGVFCLKTFLRREHHLTWLPPCQTFPQPPPAAVLHMGCNAARGALLRDSFATAPGTGTCACCGEDICRLESRTAPPRRGRGAPGHGQGRSGAMEAAAFPT
jgi:hypothetical protein